MLAPGGEFYFSDLYKDRRLPEATSTNKVTCSSSPDNCWCKPCVAACTCVFRPSLYSCLQCSAQAFRGKRPSRCCGARVFWGLFMWRTSSG